MLKGAIDILINDSTVQGLVGQNKAADKYKVYPGICPEPESDPYIVLRITDAPDFAESKNAVVNSREYTFIAIVYSRNYEDCEEIAEAVKTTLDQASGTHNGIDFDVIRYMTLADGYEDTKNLHFKTMTFNAVTNE